MIRMGRTTGPRREVRGGGHKKVPWEYRSMKSVCVLSILLGLATGAAAGEYYVVQDASTRLCTIVETPPTTTQLVLLEKGKVFFDRDEAKKAATLCASKTASAVATPPRPDEVASTTKSKARTTASKAASGRPYQSARSRTAGSRAAIAHAQSVGSRPFPSFFSLFR
jgi:hypothetical protein